MLGLAQMCGAWSPTGAEYGFGMFCSCVFHLTAVASEASSLFTKIYGRYWYIVQEFRKVAGLPNISHSIIIPPEIAQLQLSGKWGRFIMLKSYQCCAANQALGIPVTAEGNQSSLMDLHWVLATASIVATSKLILTIWDFPLHVQVMFFIESAVGWVPHASCMTTFAHSVGSQTPSPVPKLCANPHQWVCRKTFPGVSRPFQRLAAWTAPFWAEARPLLPPTAWSFALSENLSFSHLLTPGELWTLKMHAKFYLWSSFPLFLSFNQIDFHLNYYFCVVHIWTHFT